MTKKPMFPIARAFIDKMREKKVRERAVDRLGDAVLEGSGHALGEEAGRRLTNRIRRP